MTRNTTTHLIGRDDDGARYYAEIRLDESGRAVEFTDHTTGTLTHEFGVCGFIIDYRRRTAHTAGQCVDEFARVTRPAPGWTLDDVASLVTLWRGYHLNSMYAGSDEHDANSVVGDVDSTGYRYGSAWLARQIPGAVLDEARRLRALPTGNVPTNY